MTAGEADPPLPSVVVIGAPATAAPWIRKLLSEQQGVFSPVGESTFFVAGMGAGLGACRARFAGWAGEPVRLEFSPAYLLHRSKPPLVAARLQAALPDVRVVAVVANPVTRAHQAYLFHQRAGRLPSEVTFDDFVRSTHHGLDALEVVAAGRYDITLEPYVERFGDHLLVVGEEEFLRDPLGVWRRLLDFVELRRFDTEPPRALLRFDPEAPPWRIKTTAPDPATIERCRALLKPAAEGLERLLGVSVADRWFS